MPYQIERFGYQPLQQKDDFEASQIACEWILDWPSKRSVHFALQTRLRYPKSLAQEETGLVKCTQNLVEDLQVRTGGDSEGNWYVPGGDQITWGLYWADCQLACEGRFHGRVIASQPTDNVPSDHVLPGSLRRDDCGCWDFLLGL